MTPEEMGEIEQRVLALLQLDPNLHARQHEWLAVKIEEEKTRASRNEEIRRHVEKWGIVGVLTFVVGAVWHWLSKGNHGG